MGASCGLAQARNCSAGRIGGTDPAGRAGSAGSLGGRQSWAAGSRAEAVWWQPPEPVLERAEGAARVRSALETAVAGPFKDGSARICRAGSIRAVHQMLSAIRTSAPQYRLLARPHDASGVTLRLPFLDDRVVEAVLSVRPEGRASPWRYKPALAEATAEIVPAPILDRPMKGDLLCELGATPNPLGRAGAVIPQPPRNRVA